MLWLHLLERGNIKRGREGARESIKIRVAIERARGFENQGGPRKAD
jgi:hypothetical protein